MNPVIFADEIWVKIFQYLTLEDLFFCIPNVCKHFYQISKDNAIWEPFGSKDWKNEKNIKAMYLKWVREQVDNHLKNKFNYFTPRGVPPRDDKQDYDLMQKFLVVGDSGVGKSCLLLRYADDTFVSHFISTIGVDFKIKKLKIQERDLNVKLQIWDTGTGRERFRTITTSYYRNAHAILVCFDTSNNKSLDNVKRWYDSAIANANSEVTIVAVGTKCDIRNAEVVNEVENYCKSLNIKCFETSAKDNININEVFYCVTNAILDGPGLSVGPKVTPKREFFIQYCNKHINVQSKKPLCSLQ